MEEAIVGSVSAGVPRKARGCLGGEDTATVGRISAGEIRTRSGR
jgi:hypothetical protein